MTHDKAGSLDAGIDGFRPVEVVAEPVHEVGRETARSGYRIFRGADGFEAAVAEQVVERSLAIGKKAAPSEWYGLLVGRLYRDDRGSHVVVLGLVPDPEAFASTGYVETTHASEFRTRALARLVFPDAVILGWAHGHVGHGARYSATDRKNQATWTQPHAIGIVVDPFHPEGLAVYRGPEAELLKLAVQDGEPDTLRTPATPKPEEAPTDGPTAVPPDAPAAPPVASKPQGNAALKAGVLVSLVVALGCLVAVAFLARRVRALDARVRAAEAAEVRMAATLGTILETLQDCAQEDDTAPPSGTRSHLKL